MAETRLVNGRYALAANPKRGGMAEVYAASDLQQGARKIALKLFKEEYTHSGLLAEAFRRESQALRDLRHPRIIELLDSGVDEETGRHYLALEWVDQDLSEWLPAERAERFPGWDSFYNDFGRHILEALAFSHTRQVIHRDIKPSNILIEASGLPKLADFGIAKIKQWIDPGKTLQDWVSRPFSPPEWDDGSFTYTRDVYGFATIVLYCLTEVPLKTYDDLDRAREGLDAPDEVLAILQRCLSKNPHERYQNAIVLLDELDRVQEERLEYWKETVTYYLQLTNKALASLRIAFPGESDQTVRRYVLQDLLEVAGFAPHHGLNGEGNQNIREGQCHLYGANLHYHLVVDTRTKAHYVVLNAWKRSPTQLEISRETAYKPKCAFAFGAPPDATRASEQLAQLMLAIEEHQAEWRLRDAERRELELFQTWNKIVNAKSDIERAKETPLNYRRWEQDGNRIRLQISQALDEDLIGQPRRIDVDQRPVIIGEVESFDGDWLTLYITRQFDDRIPPAGKLVFDVSAAQVALKRQKDSLDAIRFLRAVRPDLRRLLARPGECRQPGAVDISSFYQTDLDEAKQKAVALACSLEDFLLVEGPPGTGKTTFIAETALQYLQRFPRARILLTSQTHVALDNAAERIRRLSADVRLLRLGPVSDEKIAPGVRDLLLPAQMERWRREVLLRSHSYLNEWATVHDISPHQFEVGRTLQVFVLQGREIAGLEGRLAELDQDLRNAGLQNGARDQSKGKKPERGTKEEPEEVQALREDIARLESEIKQRRAERKTLEKGIRDLEPLAKEILDGPPEEIPAWAESFLPDNPNTKHFKELLDIRTEWEARFGKGPEFHAALIASTQVIAGTCIGAVGVKGILDIDFDLCIVDEASKATPTELLVPLSRSRRWILVGDPRQLPPFEDEALHNDQLLAKYDLHPEDIRETLFDRLLQLLPEGCRAPLLVQHRMVPPIGNLVSECFYDGALRSAEQALDSGLARVLARPAVWMTTCELHGRLETRNDFSYANQCEGRVIARLLDGLNRQADASGARYSVALLSGYLAQIKLLRREIARRLDAWQAIDIECNTVDAFQGREADIAIYSVTRSNTEGDIGFLRDIRRLNVALSRGRKYLVIVGDHLFAKSATGENPFAKVVDHIERHPSECMILRGVL